MQKTKVILAAVFLATTSLAGCSKDDTLVEPSSSTDPGLTEVSACASATGLAKIICLTETLKGQLSSTQVAALQLSYTKSDAVRWSNFPQQLFNLKRVGLSLGSLNATQLGYVNALLAELAGSAVPNEGWPEVQQILNADNYLNTINANGGYGSGNYYLAILGTPSTTGTFAIMFGGHHLAFQNTYTNGLLAGVTPSFRGIEPVGAFTFNNTTNVPLDQENAALLAILNSLSEAELGTAKLATTTTDLVAGPQKETIPTTYAGLKCGNLTPAQKQLVLDAIKTYVADVAGSEAFLSTYQNELDNTYVSYSGNKTLSVRGDYLRIHGPSVWIEWAVQPAVALAQPHVHSVWRDRAKDYGGN
jgi:hypothetical protein